MTADREKAEAYAQSYLARFRQDVEDKKAALAIAEERLLKAEAEYSRGDMVTGHASGVPPILRGMLGPRLNRGMRR